MHQSSVINKIVLAFCFVVTVLTIEKTGILPPPQLHTGILGPGNDCIQFLEKTFPERMEQFKKKHHIKGSGPGNTYNGPTLKRIMENKNGLLEDLSKLVSNGEPGFQLFIQHLHNLGQLNVAVNMKTLDLDLMRTIIGDIEDIFKQLQDQFDLSMPLNPIIPGLFLNSIYPGGGKFAPPYKMPNNGREVPKLSWNLISYRD